MALKLMKDGLFGLSIKSNTTEGMNGKVTLSYVGKSLQGLYLVGYYKKAIGVTDTGFSVTVSSLLDLPSNEVGAVELKDLYYAQYVTGSTGTVAPRVQTLSSSATDPFQFMFEVNTPIRFKELEILWQWTGTFTTLSDCYIAVLPKAELPKYSNVTTL